jgi:hypothetical protein
MPNIGSGISGIGGNVRLPDGSDVYEIRKWSWTPKCATPMYASNRTSGFKRAVPGVKSGTGSLDYVHDPGHPFWTQIQEGNYYTLSLDFSDPNRGIPWAPSSGATWTVPSLFGSIKYDVDMDEGGIIGGSADFVTNGAWTNPSAGLICPPGYVPNQDGSAPEEAESMMSQRAIAMLSPDQLAEFATTVAESCKKLDVPYPPWLPTPREAQQELAMAGR